MNYLYLQSLDIRIIIALKRFTLNFFGQTTKHLTVFVFDLNDIYFIQCYKNHTFTKSPLFYYTRNPGIN